MLEVSARCVNTRARLFGSARHGYMKIRCKSTNPQSKSETSRCSQHFWCTACNQDCFEFQQLFRMLPDLCRSHDFVLRRSHNEATRVLQTIPLQAWCVSQHNIWIVRLAEKESQKHIPLNEGSISIPSTWSEKWGKSHLPQKKSCHPSLPKL